MVFKTVKGYRINKGGYKLIKCLGHPREHGTYGAHYVFEHILVFEQTNNCCLLKWGAIHHKDGNTLNNVWYNLQGMMRWQHTTLHKTKDMSDRRCSICGTNRTYLRKLKRGLGPIWFISKINKQYLCQTCYNKERWLLGLCPEQKEKLR